MKKKEEKIELSEGDEAQKQEELLKRRNAQKVKKYITAVQDSLRAFYGGKVPLQFQAQLQQLADFYAAYLQAAEQFKAEDSRIVTYINGGKTACTNATLAAMLSISNHMDKLIKNFGLSPLALKRILGTIGQDDEDDFLDTI